MAKKVEARKVQLDHREQFLSKPITVYFHDATLDEMLEHLQKITGANFVVPDEIKQDQGRKTLFIQEMPLEDVLQQILEGYKEFTYSVKNQTVSITKPVTAH
jgi:type II secretory pathway component GspD/PulD (secretin)